MKKIFLLILIAVLSQYTYSQTLNTLIDSATNYKNNQIKTNGVNSITGQIMNIALQKIIDALHYIDSTTAGITTDSIQVQYPLAIQVQNGIKTFLLKNHVDSITVVNDSDYWWGAGTPHVIGARNSGSGSSDTTFRIYKQVSGDSVFYVKNGITIFAFKDSSYNQPLLHSSSVPYVGTNGKLTEDNANFNYNGNLTVGNGGFYTSTGLRLNGGRATLTASGWGAQFSTQGGLPADASKSITFYNSQRPYLTMYMPNSDPNTTPMEGEAYMHWWPAITDSFELGHSTKEWKNAYIKNLYINGTLFNSNLSGTYIPLTDKAANNGVATLNNSGKVPLSQLPAFTLNQPVYVQTIAEMLSSSASVADVYVVADSSKSYALATEPASTLSDWIELLSPIPTNTDLLPEGSTNKYYTDTRARNAVGVTGTGLTYNATTGLFANTRKPDWDAITGSDNEILNKPIIPVQFQPLGSKNISIDSTYPHLVFSVKEIYDSTQIDSIIDVLKSEINSTYSSIGQAVDKSYFTLIKANGIVDTVHISGGNGSGSSITTLNGLIPIAPLYIHNVNDSTHELRAYMSTDSTFGDATDSTLSSSLAIKRKIRSDSTVLQTGLAGKEPVQSGTGYVKKSGTTPSYVPQIPLSTDVIGLLPIANGGTGTATPSIVGGANVTVTGLWPNQTISASGNLSSTNFVFNETPSGAINGSNTTFTTANTPITGTVNVLRNGLLQQVGSGNDYTITSTTITFTTAPETGDAILVNYLK